MRRRDLIMGIAGSAAAWPLAARAQQPERMRRIGVLMASAESDPQAQLIVAFRDGLQKLGWVEGRNILIDYRWAAFDPESRQRSARELVVLQPDILLCFLARSEVLPSDAP
jgi:putative ABC transport system substrate-binding protein